MLRASPRRRKARVRGRPFGRDHAECEDHLERLLDRHLEENDLGIPDPDRLAPRPPGNSNEGKPGTRKGRFGKQQRTRFGGRR